MSNTLPPQNPIGAPAGGVPALPDLPGFDTTAALKLLNNNQKLYGNVLKRFLGQYEPLLAQMTAQFTSLPGSPEELELLQREAHTLKGLSGTIGHPAMHEAAVKYDAAAKVPDQHNQAEFKELGQALADTLAQALNVLKAAFPPA
ncbi:MAG: Hpt domain-containing protein [Deltaproteobacteria bacterium]|jgi:HPt (histidine-containing phosphotransfer) domain-containing protein|nr:Hpt domain-containing protein [Deltaproteobacteria bacterium]